MEFTHVTASCSEIKAMAKLTMKGRWLKLALPMLPVILLMYLPRMLFSLNFAEGLAMYLVYALGIVLLGILSYGCAAYMLGVFRMDEHPAARLLDPVSARRLFFKSVGLFSLIALLCMIGFFLFVIPGIIAVYKYSQAFNILYDHPEYTPTQCLLASAAMMKGNKGQRFTLDLSFLLWYLLPIVPIVIVIAPVMLEVMQSTIAYMQALTPEELEPIMTDEAAYTAFMDQLLVMENDVLQSYLDAHASYSLMEWIARGLQLVLSAVSTVFTGCASVCFYELASGKLSLKNESELHSAADHVCEV